LRPGDDGRARYARRPFHDSPLGSPVLAAAAETVHQAKARGHRRKMNPMMGKGQARYTFTRYHRSRLVRNSCCLNSPISQPTVLAMGLRQDRRAGLAAFMLRRFTGRENPVHYCVRNTLGTAIVKLIDATKGGTEPAYKHFNQQIWGVVQTCLYRLRCECNNPANCSGMPSTTQATNTLRGSSGNSFIDRSRMSRIAPSASSWHSPPILSPHARL